MQIFVFLCSVFGGGWSGGIGVVCIVLFSVLFSFRELQLTLPCMHKLKTQTKQYQAEKVGIKQEGSVQYICFVDKCNQWCN